MNAVYQSESRRVLATLIRLLGDFDVAEEALHDAFRAALEQWPREGVPAESPRLAGVGRAIQGDRRHPAPEALRRRSTKSGAAADIAVDDTAAWADPESVEDDRLRLIFTCCHPALSPDAQVALTLREVCGLTTEEIAQRVPDAGADAGAAHRAREEQDSRRAHSLPGAVAGRPARAARRGAAGDLPGVQRGLRGLLGRDRDAARPVGRGDPPGTAARRSAAGAGSRRAARADAAARFAAGRARDAGWRRDPARESGPVALGPRSDRRRHDGWSSGRSASRQAGPYSIQAAIAAVHAERARRRGNRLGGDRRPLRRALAARSVAGHRAESRGGGRDARRPGRRPGADRRDPRPRRSARLPAGACGARRLVPPARDERRTRARRTSGRSRSRKQEPERRFLERRLAELSSSDLGSYVDSELLSVDTRSTPWETL